MQTKTFLLFCTFYKNVNKLLKTKKNKSFSVNITSDDNLYVNLETNKIRIPLRIRIRNTDLFDDVSLLQVISGSILILSGGGELRTGLNQKVLLCAVTRNLDATILYQNRS